MISLHNKQDSNGSNGSDLHPSDLEPQKETVPIPSAHGDSDVTATAGKQATLTGPRKSSIWAKRLGFQAKYEFFLCK